MGVRCLGAITRDRLEVLHEADAIVREEIDRAGLTIWQYFAVVPDFRVTAEVPGICRVCYDLTPKPVGTVEWE